MKCSDRKIECSTNTIPAQALAVNKAKWMVMGLVLSVAIVIPNRQLIAAGPSPVNLGSCAHFTILSGAAVTTTGGGVINGDVGASPITGSAIHLLQAQVNATIYAVDASGPAGSVIAPSLLTTAKGDLTVAFNDAANRTPTPTGPFLNPGSGNIGGLNLVPGLYKFTGTALITGSDVTLTGGSNDVWIFQIAADLEEGSGIHVILAGGAQARNIFWQVGTSATIGTFAVFNGTIIASQAITMNTSSSMNGRALAFTAGVTFNGWGASLPPTQNTTTVINDFNGDGKSDLAQYNASNGNWYIETTGGVHIVWGANWGYAGAIPVPGDYNGDGKADMAVYDTKKGLWYIKTVSNSVIAYGVNWGSSTMIPVSGDYDGDGKADLAVYDTNTGNWSIRTVSGSIITNGVNWGYHGAIPVSGDYDGDGKSDLAVYDTNTGNWYIRTVAGAQIAYGNNWGYHGAIPVSADFDGNGRSDQAVYDTSNGNWFIRTLSGINLLPANRSWGYAGAIPVAGDYNGDGESEMAVCDKNSGVWYIRTVSGKVLVWGLGGQPGTIPVK